MQLVGKWVGRSVGGWVVDLTGRLLGGFVSRSDNQSLLTSRDRVCGVTYTDVVSIDVITLSFVQLDTWVIICEDKPSVNNISFKVYITHKQVKKKIIGKGVLSWCTAKFSKHVQQLVRRIYIWTMTLKVFISALFLQGKMSLYLFLGRFSGFLASSMDMPGFFLYNSYKKSFWPLVIDQFNFSFLITQEKGPSLVRP